MLHSVNNLANTTYRNGMYIHRLLGTMESDRRMNLGLNKIAIRTSDFCVSSHTDKNDACTGDFRENIMREWKRAVNQDYLCMAEKMKLKSALKFAEDLGLGVHTTCCYQFVRSGGEHDDEDGDQTVPYQLFVFPTLGVSRVIRNYDAHLWMASVVQHATCVPMFVKRGLVTFGHHNDVSIEAWGNGKKKKQ